MNRKLTLQMEEGVVKGAKAGARRRRKCGSRMVAEFIESLSRPARRMRGFAPNMASLTSIPQSRGI